MTKQLKQKTPWCVSTNNAINEIKLEIFSYLFRRNETKRLYESYHETLYRMYLNSITPESVEAVPLEWQVNYRGQFHK